MGKYEQFKQLTLPLSVVKKFFTTTGNSGRQAMGASGNEGIVLAEWIQERIDDGTIISGSSPSTGTDLSYALTSSTVTVTSSTGTDAVLPAVTSTMAGVMTSDDKIKLESLITLTGLPPGDTTLGIFSGTIIPDNMDIKSALQFLESKLDTIPTITQGDLESSDTVISITNGVNAVLGTGTTVTFNPGNLNLSDVGGLLNINQISTTGAATNDVLIFNGTTWVIDSIPVVPVDHIDLLNLQGGVTGEYYHLSESVYDKLATTTANRILGRVSTLGEVQELTLGGSLVFNSSSVQLAGDSLTPGNNKYWGTDGSGNKGFHALTAIGTVTNFSATNSADLTFTVTNPTSTPDVTAVLTNTGVTAGSYGSSSSVPNFTVNSKGRITSATNIPISLTSINISDFTETVQDTIATTIIAGSNIGVTYNDALGTVTISTTSNYTGVANRVAWWSDPSTLTTDDDLKFDGTYLSLGNPSGVSLAKFTSKGVGNTLSTYGYIHQSSAGNEVFKVADNGAITIGTFGEVFIHPDSINLSTGGTFPIQVSGGDLSLYSDQTVVIEGGGTSTNLPSFKSVATRSTNIGSLYNAQITGNVEMTIGGTNTFTDLLVDTRVNQVGHTGIIRSVHIKPIITASNNYIGLDIDVPSTETALKVTSGEIRFEIPGTNTGDIYYRKADGTIGVVPIGGPSEVLGSTGTIPAWTTTAGSLPGGMNGDVLMYVSGSWAAASPTTDKQSGITGTTVTLGATPLGSTLFILYRNGVYQDDSADYTRVGNVVTLAQALISTDKIIAIYYT